MFLFPSNNGRHYLTLIEVSKLLGLSKEDVLYHFKREALIYLKCQAVAKDDFNDNDYDIDKIKWIEGLFWLPVDAYVELEFLLNNEITSIRFYELQPYSIYILDTGYFNGDATQRCHVTCEDWLYIKYPDVTDYVLRSVDDLYFWEDTIQEFAEKNGFNYFVPEHLLSLDVISKQIKNDTNNTKEPINTKANFSGLERINKRKADIQGMARVMATHFWRQDTSQTTIGDMADKVYRFISDYVDVNDMPENTSTVADWIREKGVTPDYATKGGRRKATK